MLTEDERLIRIAEALYGLDEEDDDPFDPLPRWGDLTDECRYQMLRRAKSCVGKLARIVSGIPAAQVVPVIEKMARAKLYSPDG